MGISVSNVLVMCGDFTSDELYKVNKILEEKKGNSYQYDGHTNSCENVGTY